MNPPLSRTAKIWLVAMLTSGMGLLAAIAWLGGGRSGHDARTAEEAPGAEDTVAPPAMDQVRKQARPLTAGRVPRPPAPVTAPVPPPAAPPPEAAPARSPTGFPLRAARSLRDMVLRMKRHHDGGMPAAP